MTAAIDITTEQRKTLLAHLRRFISGVAVWAYGSRVKWTARPNSDLDLVAFTTPAQRHLVSELKEALGESNLPFLIDFHVWDEVPERFHEIIRKEYVVLQEAKQSEDGVSVAAEVRHFGQMFAESTRNGLTRPKSVRGIGVKMVNMGELFAYPRLCNAPMDRVPLNVAEAEKFLLVEGDLLFARQSLVLEGAGKCSIFLRDAEPVTFESHITRVRLDENSGVPLFYFYYMQSNHGRAAIRSIVEQGAGASGIRGSDLKQLNVLWRPIDEQRTIARILGTLDDKIELNQRMNATLDAMARALFQSWFVNFDPVRAKLDGRQPEGIDAATAVLFPAHFQESEDGKLPVGWRHTSVEDMCSINAWTLGKSDDLDTLEYVEISEVNRGNVANISTYQRGEEPSRARRRLRHGDTVLSTVRPDRGSYFLALNPPENRVASTGFAVITPTKAPWAFIHAALTQADFSEHLGQLADGGAYPAVRPEIIGAWEVAVPDHAEILDAFQNICAPLFEQAEANRNQSRTLVTLRDALLPLLMSGKLRVPNGQLPEEELV